MERLAAASLVVLLGLAGGYLFAYRLRRSRIFLYLGLAWLANIPYLLAEDPDWAFRGQVLCYLLSLPTTLLFYLALRRVARSIGPPRSFPTLLAFTHLLAWSIPPLLVASIYLDLTPSARFLTLHSPGVAVTATVLFALGLTILRAPTPLRLLAITGLLDQIDPSWIVPPAPSGDQEAGGANVPQETLERQNSVAVAQPLLGFSFLLYGTVQCLYLLKPFVGPQLFLFPFWFAFATKVANGLGLAFLLLADFRFVSEAFRVQSLTAELGALTASVEHDIRSPISLLQKTTFLLKRRYQHDASIQKLAGDLDTQVDRIEAAVDVIPQFRETPEFYRNRFKKWNLLDVARTAHKHVKETHEGLPIRIDLECSRSEIMVMAYRERVLQAFVNILTNSIEAYRMTDPPRSAVIKMTIEQSTGGALVLVRIHDEAGGIDPKILSNITRPLFTTKSDRKVNRGLGLFTATRFIEQHGGRLTFDSDGQTYTDVLIELPAGRP